MPNVLSFVLHLDTHLQNLVHHLGAWSYAILFGFLFAETGFVITPFLPGDSLVFVTGSLLAKHIALNSWLCFVVLAAGAIVGDSVNFLIGQRLGPRIFQSGKVPFLNPANLERTQGFFRRYGGKTIVIARFVPVVRTFAPFVAGTGKMEYRQFVAYNIVGALLWVGLFVIGGFLFGNMPLVRSHFAIVLVAVIVLSLAPAVFEVWRAHREPVGASTQEGKVPAQARS